MRYYETLFLINPNLSDDEYGEIKTKFIDLIEKNNGVVVHLDDWGKKNLAYQIKKFDKGYYVLIYYCGEGNIILEFERALKLDERVLKYQTVKLSDQADPEALKVKHSESNKEGSAEDEGSDETESEDDSDTNDEWGEE